MTDQTLKNQLSDVSWRRHDRSREVGCFSVRDLISKYIKDGCRTTSVGRKEHLAFHRDKTLENSGRKYHVIVRHK
jgi:hypothetical protein